MGKVTTHKRITCGGCTCIILESYIALRSKKCFGLYIILGFTLPQIIFILRHCSNRLDSWTGKYVLDLPVITVVAVRSSAPFFGFQMKMNLHEQTEPRNSEDLGLVEMFGYMQIGWSVP
jgi:hypothetical protein